VSGNFLLQVNRTTPYEMDRDIERDSLYEGMRDQDFSDEVKPFVAAFKQRSSNV
jgi:hypothetical protein